MSLQRNKITQSKDSRLKEVRNQVRSMRGEKKLIVSGEAEDDQIKELADLHWAGVPHLLDPHQHHQPCV